MSFNIAKKNQTKAHEKQVLGKSTFVVASNVNVFKYVLVKYCSVLRMLYFLFLFALTVPMLFLCLPQVWSFFFFFNYCIHNRIKLLPIRSYKILECVERSRRLILRFLVEAGVEPECHSSKILGAGLEPKCNTTFNLIFYSSAWISEFLGVELEWKNTTLAQLYKIPSWRFLAMFVLCFNLERKRSLANTVKFLFLKIILYQILVLSAVELWTALFC